MNLLITGASGQLGTELRGLTDCFPEHNYTFVTYEELDITDAEALDALVREQQIEVIINCAAYTAVDKAESEPELADRVNHLGAQILGQVSAQRGCYLIHVSTDYVFAGDNSVPYTEADPTAPTSVYGRTKCLGEEAIRTSGCAHLILRTAWLYSLSGANFLLTMLRLTRERESLNVVADQIGSPTWARSLAHFILSALSHGRPTQVGTYHYTQQGVASWYDFAVAINELAGHHCRIRPIPTSQYPTPAARPHYSVLSKQKIERDFAIEIPHWREALQECLRDYSPANH